MQCNQWLEQILLPKEDEGFRCNSMFVHSFLADDASRFLDLHTEQGAGLDFIVLYF